VPKVTEPEESDEPVEQKVTQKRKVDTDCKNAGFEEHLKQRRAKSPTNF
jgi:hypothetical protein